MTFSSFGNPSVLKPIKLDLEVFSSLKTNIQDIYYHFYDRRIKDLSSLKSEKAMKYLDRFDVKRKNSYMLLRSALKHSNRQVIFQTIEVLKQNRNINSRKILNTLLNNKDQEIVIAAIDALRAFKTNDIIKPLTGCLIRKDRNIALAALWTLAEIKTPEAIEAIETVFESGNEELQKTALWMLKGIKSTKNRTKKAASR